MATGLAHAPGHDSSARGHDIPATGWHSCTGGHGTCRRGQRDCSWAEPRHRDLMVHLRALLADQIDALLAHDRLENVQARVAEGLHRDSLDGLVIGELAPRLAVAEDLLRLGRQ